MSLSPNAQGALWMTASMAGFAVEDTFIKSAAGAVPVGQVLASFGVIGTLIFAMLCLRRGERLVHPALFSRPMAARCSFEMLGRVFYTLAIALTPLSTASAILQAAPLVVALGAMVVLREPVSPARWLAIFVGFAGVLLVLRPGLDGFDTLAILSVLGMVGFAGRDLATRAAPPALSHMQLSLYGCAILIPAGLVILAFEGAPVMPSGPDALRILAAALAGSAAYFALTNAMRTGDVGVVAPFRYTRLVVAMGLAALVFGERPDSATLVGSAIIVAAGLIALATGRRRRPAVKPAGKISGAAPKD
ncbi:DMT family transporter [Vannielia litorea]|uniref:DMT family transporter n=1 Tax=Vannielia litorea TaxID=1217970 RepID=UPI001BCED7D0|nr:DMT family transporter [Vannielia litorea]MBS8226074.1 DMT family transporter [Vannielia litorea]